MNSIKLGVSTRVHQTACWIGDRITDWTGYAAAKIPLQRAKEPRELTLDLPGYMQLNSYCCGAVTVAMVVRYFWPQTSFGRIYATVNPSPEYGAGITSVARALRTCRVYASRQRKLTFEQLCSAIHQNRPVLVAIHNPGAETDHWVVVYGYGRRPDRVFIACNGLPWFGSNRMARREFEGIWKPRGNGIICCKDRGNSRSSSKRPFSK
jgi:hypothetical protein